MVKIGIITVSDRAHKGVYEDLSGKAIRNTLSDYLISEWMEIHVIVPDEQEVIEGKIVELVDNDECSLVITTGGTGPAKRDVTPEATEAVCDRMMPGFGELMRTKSLKFVPTAILSRQTAGLRGSSLIINFVNIIFFYIGSVNIYNSYLQLTLILTLIFIYSISYTYLFYFRYRFKN